MDEEKVSEVNPPFHLSIYDPLPSFIAKACRPKGRALSGRRLNEIRVDPRRSAGYVDSQLVLSIPRKELK
jgi:hypothetical protein